MKNNYVPKISFLLLNWNGLLFTKECVRSLLKTKYPNFEIIIVDNGSDKDEAGTLEKEFKQSVKVIRNIKNIGYAAGMNVAIKNSVGKYLMLLNNDMEFEGNWLMPLVKILENNSKIAACQPKIKDLRNKKMFEHGGASGGFHDILGYPFARGRVFSFIERDYGQYDKPMKISWCGVMLIRKKVLDKIGYFKSIYFNYGEDMDLCYRIYGIGYQIFSVPQSIVYHFGGGSLKKNMQRKFFYHHRNNIIFLLINYSPLVLATILLPRILMDFTTIFYYLFTGYPSFSIIVIKAYFSVAILLPHIFKERKKTQKILLRNSLKFMPIYKGSIVLDYFLFKRRTFADILKNSSSFKNSIFNNL